MTATPAILHQVIVGNLYWVLRGHVQPRGLGQVYLAPVTGLEELWPPQPPTGAPA